MSGVLTREKVIVAMLESYRLVDDAAELGQGSDPSDDRVLLMNPLWHEGSYAELYRCLYVMREQERQLYWHVAERYLRSLKRQVRDHCPVCKRPTTSVHTHHHRGQRQRFKPTDVIEERWHPGVDLRKVEVGVHWISLEHRGEPFLPDELYHLLAA